MAARCKSAAWNTLPAAPWLVGMLLVTRHGAYVSFPHTFARARGKCRHVLALSPLSLPLVLSVSATASLANAKEGDRRGSGDYGIRRSENKTEERPTADWYHSMAERRHQDALVTQGLLIAGGTAAASPVSKPTSKESTAPAPDPIFSWHAAQTTYAKCNPDAPGPKPDRYITWESNRFVLLSRDGRRLRISPPPFYNDTRDMSSNLHH